MFNNRPQTLTEVAEAEQLKLFSELEGLSPDSKEFATIVEYINKIDAVKTKKTRISRDAVLSGAVNILGILTVLYFERTGAVVSKSFGMIKKA